MKGKILLSILLSALFLRAASTGIDSLIKFSDLTFRSDYEREAFLKHQLNGNTSDLLPLFLNNYIGISSVNRSKVGEQIANAVSFLEKETEGMNEAKRVKFIYKYVHRQFLKMYWLQNSFTDIFERGEYNCVSASALYGLIFTRMSIPFLVMEAPQHVYLIAYPNKHKILIESTSPTNGYFIFKDNYTQKFIRYLMDAKIISADEFANNTIESLFNKYYYDKNGLSLLELAGVQYCNYSAYYAEDNNYTKSLEEVKRAYYLWPAEKTRYLLQWLLSYNVGNCKFESENDIKNLTILCKINSANDSEIRDDFIKYEFGKLMQAQLTEKSDYSQMEKSYTAVYSALSDSVLKNEIAFAYHYELGRLGYLNFSSKEYELQHLRKAYSINPQHADLRTIIKSYFGKLVDKTEDPNLIYKYLEEYTKSFDFVKSDNDFNSVRCNSILELAYQSFVLNNVVKGESYLKEFETICNSDIAIKPSERYVERAYATVAGYYYKRGNVVRTREFLRKGIKYAPENFGLIRRLVEAR